MNSGIANIGWNIEDWEFENQKWVSSKFRIVACAGEWI